MPVSYTHLDVYKRQIPNMTVICTSDDTQTRWAVNEIAKFEGPVYLRLCRLATPKIYEDEKFEIGKGCLLDTSYNKRRFNTSC